MKKIRQTLSTSKKYHNNFKKKKFKSTNLYYQSSYELDFLNYLELVGFDFGRIRNGISYYDEQKLYFGDYLIDDKYCIEIKSWWIEQLQEKKNPGSLAFKQQLVEKFGHTWIYLKDKNYSSINDILNIPIPV